MMAGQFKGRGVRGVGGVYNERWADLERAGYSAHYVHGCSTWSVLRTVNRVQTHVGSYDTVLEAIEGASKHYNAGG